MADETDKNKLRAYDNDDARAELMEQALVQEEAIVRGLFVALQLPAEASRLFFELLRVMRGQYPEHTITAGALMLALIESGNLEFDKGSIHFIPK